MKSKLSSKGQLIIPKAIRHSLALKSGSQFNIKVSNRKIILELLQHNSPWISYMGNMPGSICLVL